MVLLNPGPVNVSARVRAALGQADICHREVEYFDLQDHIRARLLKALEAPAGDYTAVLLTGSGTAAVEAMIASCVSAGGRLMILKNGVYGERMALMARTYGIKCHIVEGPLTELPDLDRIRRELTSGRYECLAMVHHETTTGLLNELAPIAAMCREYGVRLLIDAVSSLGGEELDFAALRPDAAACTANKCIQGIPGIAFVLLRREFMKVISGYRERTMYLHLATYHAEQERRSTPFTPAIQAAYALAAALDELVEETLARRNARFARASSIVRDGLERSGFRLLLPSGLRSTTLTAVVLPCGVSYSDLHDLLKADGFVIYAGQRELGGTLFRVATMGAVPEHEFHRFVVSVETALRRLRSK